MYFLLVYFYNRECLESSFKGQSPIPGEVSIETQITFGTKVVCLHDYATKHGGS